MKLKLFLLTECVALRELRKSVIIIIGDEK